MVAIEFYNLLPEPYVTQLNEIINIYTRNDEHDSYRRFKQKDFRTGFDAMNAFSWDATVQGREYWKKIAENFNNLILEHEKSSYTKWEGDN